jgi:enoyl-CoA hydratase/carnithine racemase
MLDIIPQDAGIVEIRLARPPVNALDLDLVRMLRQTLEQCPAQGTQGVVLSGAQGMFSAGVDVPALMARDRNGVREYWREFFTLCGTLASMPVPVVAAVTGHSPAGGAVLALFSDYRVMAHGPYKIGLNEVQVGLPVPEAIQVALRRVVGAYRAERLLMSGAMLDAEQALAVGFVDELVGLEMVTTRALVWLREVLALPCQAMLKTRQLARADLARVFADIDALPLDAFVDDFFGDETQATLTALVDKLRNR